MIFVVALSVWKMDVSYTAVCPSLEVVIPHGLVILKQVCLFETGHIIMSSMLDKMHGVVPKPCPVARTLYCMLHLGFLYGW